MFKLLPLLFLAAFALRSNGPILGQEPTSEVQPVLPTAGELYVTMSFPVEVDPALYRNPFDSTDIELIGIFQSASGNRLVIPGFWMQPYVNRCEPPCRGFDLQPDGTPIWQVRFTPQEAGEWTYTLQVRDNGTIINTVDGSFLVAPSERRGFIHRADNRRYFQFSNGEPYFPIGHNVKWSWDEIGGLETYDRWLRELSAAGGNYARLYIDVPWFISLEWNGPAGDYSASQRAAAELDIILEKAAEYGVSLQLVMLWHQTLRTFTGPPVVLPENVPRPDVSADWDNSPYNVLNGGVLSGPSVFFFNDTAQTLFRRRLRYIVARWGHSPQVFAWEIIDQIDRTANYNPDIARSWLQGTASYLRQIDQHDHLITASSREFDPVIAENPLLDFASLQFYQRRPIETVGDQVLHVANMIQSYHEAGFGPVLLVDYSLNPWFEPTGDDPQGIHFQNTLWAAAFAGAAGGAMSDWWDTYVIPQGLMRYYGPLAAFAAGVDWSSLNLQPALAGLLTNRMDSYLPVRLSNFRRQFAVRPQSVVTRTITADGVYPDIEDVPSFLYGQVFNTQFSQAQRYRVAPPVDTYLEIAVRAVSTQADAHLVVEIDNVRVVEVNLRAGNRDVVVRVPLSAGEHSIVIDNMGTDWLELDYIEIGQLLTPARSLTLRDAEAGVVVAWLQHRDYTWEKVAANELREPILFEYRLDGMPAGRYTAEIWNPLTGSIVGEELLRVGEDGRLRLELLPLDQQLALRVVRQPEIPTPEPTAVPTALTDTATPTVTPSATLTLTSTPTSRPERTSDVTTTPVPVRRASPLPTLRPFAAVTNTPRPESSPTGESNNS